MWTAFHGLMFESAFVHASTENLQAATATKLSTTLKSLSNQATISTSTGFSSCSCRPLSHQHLSCCSLSAYRLALITEGPTLKSALCSLGVEVLIRRLNFLHGQAN